MLFEPYKLKNITLRNRVAMAPMTRSQSPGGIPTDNVVEYYKRRAKAEVGLIITEGVEVSHEASSAYPNVPRLDSLEARDGWKKVVEGIKEVEAISEICKTYDLPCQVIGQIEASQDKEVCLPTKQLIGKGSKFKVS